MRGGFRFLIFWNSVFLKHPNIYPRLVQHWQCIVTWGAFHFNLSLTQKKLLHQTALTGWDDRCLNYCVFFAVFVTKLKNKRREGGFSSLKVLIKICQKTTLQITDEITVANIWPYDFLLMGSCGADRLQWLWMLSSVTLQLWLIQSTILFLCCFWAKRDVILAKIKNDFPRVKSNHIERRAE